MAYHSEYGRYEALDVSPSRVLKWMKCPKSFEYQYVRREPNTTGLAAMQGTALHDVWLEEMLRGGIQDVDALVDLLELTFRDALENEDPKRIVDYNTKEPVSEWDKEEAVEQLKVWGKGLFEAFLNGKDNYGNKFVLPNVTETELENPPLEVHLPKTGVTLRLRGHIDLVFEDGGIGDLKLASDYYLGVWTLAKALGEIQPIFYRMIMGTPGRFSYVIADKKKGKSGAYSPTVRSIDFEVTQRDFDRGVDILEAFVHGTQVHNEYEGGFFPAIPEYNGESKKNAGLTERNFCGKMCSYKEICYNENFKRPVSLSGDTASIVED
tara:strand:- start:271 stop:1239 length:969 start_codon:yes stop_codon:yes gene_type:complete